VGTAPARCADRYRAQAVSRAALLRFVVIFAAPCGWLLSGQVNRPKCPARQYGKARQYSIDSQVFLDTSP